MLLYCPQNESPPLAQSLLNAVSVSIDLAPSPLCVCVRERERERVCVYLHMFIFVCVCEIRVCFTKFKEAIFLHFRTCCFVLTSLCHQQEKVDQYVVLCIIMFFNICEDQIVQSVLIFCI